MENEAKTGTDSSEKAKEPRVKDTELVERGNHSTNGINSFSDKSNEPSTGKEMISKKKSTDLSKMRNRSLDDQGDSPGKTNNDSTKYHSESDVTKEQDTSERKLTQANSRRSSQFSTEDEAGDKQDQQYGISVPDLDSAICVALVWLVKTDALKYIHRISRTLNESYADWWRTEPAEIAQFIRSFPFPNIFISPNQHKHGYSDIPDSIHLNETDREIYRILNELPYSNPFKVNMQAFLLCKNKDRQELSPVYEKLVEVVNWPTKFTNESMTQLCEDRLLSIVDKRANGKEEEGIDEVIVAKRKMQEKMRKMIMTEHTDELEDRHVTLEHAADESVREKKTKRKGRELDILIETDEERVPSDNDNVDDILHMAKQSELMHRFMDDLDSDNSITLSTPSGTDDEEDKWRMAKQSEKMHRFMENVDRDNSSTPSDIDEEDGGSGEQILTMTSDFKNLFKEDIKVDKPMGGDHSDTDEERIPSTRKPGKRHMSINKDKSMKVRNNMSRTTGDIKQMAQEESFRNNMRKLGPIVETYPEDVVLMYLNAYIHRGKDISQVQDIRGQNLLHLCVKRNHIQVAMLLMDHEVNPMKADIGGIIPLRIAIDEELDEMAALIVSKSPHDKILQVFKRSEQSNLEEILDSKFEKTLCAVLDTMKMDNGYGLQTVDFTLLLTDEQGSLNTKSSNLTAYQKLAYDERKEVLCHPVVHALTNYKWTEFARVNFLSNAIGYLLSLFALTFACVVGATTDDVFLYDDGLQRARAVSEMSAYTSAVVSLIYVIFHMIRHRYERLQPSNYIDILASLLIIIALPVRYTHVQEHWYILAFGYMLWVTRIFNYTVYFSGIGIYSEALRRTVLQDFGQFFVVFAVILLAFSGMFLLVLRGDTSLDLSTDTSTYHHILYAGLRIMVEGGSVVEYSEYRPMSVIVMLGFLLVTIVVMLNFLIAQLSNTYAKIEAEAVKSVIANRAWIIARLEKRGFLCRLPGMYPRKTFDLSKLTPEVKVTTEEKIEKAFAESKARQVELELQIQTVKNRLVEYRRYMTLGKSLFNNSARFK